MTLRREAPWGALSPEEAASTLAVPLAVGLSDAEARRRLDEQGPNALPREGPPSWGPS
ncbi:MAG: cation-transporting P-type ATPase [Candidatus Sericytochromatia bacterium]